MTASEIKLFDRLDRTQHETRLDVSHARLSALSNTGGKLTMYGAAPTSMHRQVIVALLLPGNPAYGRTRIARRCLYRVSVSANPNRRLQ
jgi:hypothetical protein